MLLCFLISTAPLTFRIRFVSSRDLSGNAISTLIPEQVKRLPSKLLIL